MEIRAEELRIGNLFTDSTKEINVVKDGTFMAINDGIIQCEPIKLTEEWLDKFGFVGYGLKTKDKKFIIYFPEMVHYKTDIKLKHVHQLQNLYFALTNKELKIKL